MFALFGSSSPFDGDVDKATSEINTTEQWDVIIDICDRAGASPRSAKDCLRSIMKRMGHNDPHVAIQAITLLDACIKNCGKTFHLEIASRDFETEFQRLMSKSQPSVAQKMRVSLKKWADNEFKTDPQLNLIPTLYQKLKSEGADFSDSTTETPKQPAVSKDPNVVSSQQEEDDIAKAIELSLKEKGGTRSPTQSTQVTSLYPTNMNGNASPKHSVKKEGRKVRALYDFEAAEDNELTFFSGEIIFVIDDSDSNWWSGYNDRGEGLFPSNFVTADLNAEVETTNQYDFKSNATAELKEEPKQELIQIDELKIDQLLHLLHEANPEDPSQDPEEMHILEAQVNQMLPLIDSELERVDRQHAKLTQLSTGLVEAINMYHTLMRESDMQVGNYNQMPSQHMYRQPLPNEMYNPYYGMPPHQMGNQYMSPSHSMHAAGVQQYQNPENMDPNRFIPIDGSPQTMPRPNMPEQYQYQLPTPNDQHGHPNASMHLPQAHPNGMQSLPHMMPPNVGPAAPSQFHQGVMYTPNFAPVDANQMNNQNPVAMRSMMNNAPPPQASPQQPQMGGYLPNTVMTTQVQQSSAQPPMPHHQPPNPHQIVPNAIQAVNQPVSTQILPQNDLRSNIPVYQQQR